MSHSDLSSLLATVPTRSESKPKRALFEHDGGDDYVLRIDNSTLEVFQTCARAAQFYCVERRETRGSAALAFGSAVHEGLAELYRGGFSEASIVNAADVTMKHLRENFQPDSDEWRTPQCALETILAYADKYKHDTIRPVVYKDEKFIERGFSIMLGTMQLETELPYTHAKLCNSDSTDPLYIKNLHILWSGRLDMAVTEGDENVFVLDHKTSSIGGTQFFADFMLSQQMLGYSWALRQLMPERNVLGVIVNAILQRKPTRTGKSLEFIRQTFFHQKWMADEWKDDVLSGIERFVHALSVGFFPKSPKWCFGKWKCQYHEACTLPPDMRETFLASDEYVNVTWSPLDK